MNEINPGDGWRLLRPDEVVSEGDEIAFIGGWAPAIAFGACVGRYGKYRRRIPSKPEHVETYYYEFDIDSKTAMAVLTFFDEQAKVDATEARQLADWLNRYADWQESRNTKTDVGQSRHET